MSLTRKAIRAKLVELLENETDAGARVYASRVNPVEQSGLPAILVYTPGDTREIDSQPKRYAVDLHIRVEIVHEGDDDIADDLDDLASQVEYVLDQDFTLGDNVEDLIHEGTEITIDREGNKHIGSVVMTYKARYYKTAVTDPVFLDQFDTAHTDWVPDGATSASPETQDTVTGLYE